MQELASTPSGRVPPRPRKPTDLGVRDWLDAGQSLLRDGGLRALKLRPLAAKLGVSTGSFYHHFNDFPAYQAALAAYFSGEQISEVLREASTGPGPLSRIDNLVIIVARDGLSRLGLAMRAWAESDPRARASVQAQDEAVLGFLTDNLLGLGYSDAEARIRAYALLAAGLGSISGTNGLPGAVLKVGLLRLLCGGGEPTPS